MTIAAPPPGLQPEDYDEIEAAVMETARGRWFLSEYARRARATETERLREALARIEARLDALGAPPKVQAVPVIERLDRLLWTLRESGVDDFVCSKIERLTRDLAAGGMIMDAPVPQAKLDAGSATSGSCGASNVGPATAAATPALPDATPDVESDEPAHPRAKNPRGSVETQVPQETVEAAPPNLPQFPAVDPRLDALLWLDRLPLLDRIALFA